MSAKDIEGDSLISQDISRWKPSTFKERICSNSLCVIVGNGVHIAGIAFIGVLSSASGLSSSWSSRGLILTAMIITYLLSSILSGYVCVWLWRCFSVNGDSEGWSLASWCNSCAFPGVGFAIFTVLSIIEYTNDTADSISLPVYFALLALWILVYIPLSRLGGFLASRSKKPMQSLTRISQNQRETLARETWYSWFLVLVAGLVPTGAITFELYFDMINIAFGTFNQAFPFVSLLFLLVVISCAMVSVGLTYRCIVVEDSVWWWKAFGASGSAGIYLFFITVKYYVVDGQGVSGLKAYVVYPGHLMILCAAVALAAGAIGFLSAVGFIRILCFLEKLGFPISVNTKHSVSSEMYVEL